MVKLPAKYVISLFSWFHICLFSAIFLSKSWALTETLWFLFYFYKATVTLVEDLVPEEAERSNPAPVPELKLQT